MMAFDTLDNLEGYTSLSSHLTSLIDVLDRSLPYDQKVGRYVYPDDEGVEYEVSAFLTGSGFSKALEMDKTYVEITLEGESVSSVGESVFRLLEGRFLLLKGEGEIKRGISPDLPKSVKSVLFTLDDEKGKRS